MKCVAIIAISLAALAVSVAGGPIEGTPVDWYDCRGVANGDYVHPVDCTRFMTCSNELAYERECAYCEFEPIRCPHGRLVFDKNALYCEWAHMAECGAGGCK